MKTEDIEIRLSRVISDETPDVLDAILAKCSEKKLTDIRRKKRQAAYDEEAEGENQKKIN